MGMSINLHDRGLRNSIYYTDHYRQLVENHLDVLKNDPGTITVTIPTDVAYTCDTDFFSVLNHFDVPEYLHWTVLRVNGFTSPIEYRTNVVELKVPSDTLINRLLVVHRVNHRDFNIWS